MNPFYRRAAPRVNKIIGGCPRYSTANGVLVKEVYQEKHKLTTIGDAAQFVEAITRNDDKAEFAQRLAERLATDKQAFGTFVVPEYLQKAIKWVIDG